MGALPSVARRLQLAPGVRQVRMSDDLTEYRRLQFLPSRIPALDALEIFVPDKALPDQELDNIRGRSGQSRWFPVEGGHRVLILHERGPFNADRFTLREGAWNHEHCKRCRAQIPAMTLCWVSTDSSYTIVCESCHKEILG